MEQLIKYLNNLWTNTLSPTIKSHWDKAEKRTDRIINSVRDDISINNPNDISSPIVEAQNATIEAIKNIPKVDIPKTDLISLENKLDALNKTLREKEMEVNIGETKLELTPVIKAIEKIKLEVPKMEEKEVIDYTLILDEICGILEKPKDFTEIKKVQELLKPLSKTKDIAVVCEYLQTLIDKPIPEFPELPRDKNGYPIFTPSKVGGGGGGGLTSVESEALQGVATEAKQDSIIEHLPLNDELRLKVSTLPGMPDACTGVLTTTAAAATDITGTGCVGGTAFIAVDVSRASNVMFSLQNTGGTAMAAGQFAIEASLDSTNGTDGTWIGIQAVRSNANTIVTNTGTITAAAGAGAGFGFEASVNANMWFRLRVTTNVTAGAAAKWTIVRGSYATEPVPAMQSHAVTLSSTTIGGSASVGGFSQFRNVALSNTDVAVKTSAGRVYAIEAVNPNASTGAWLHFYNALIANVTVGTTVPVWSMYIPANSTRREYLTIPMTMATAITVAATTSAAHDVSTAPTTALVVFIGYI